MVANSALIRARGGKSMLAFDMMLRTSGYFAFICLALHKLTVVYDMYNTHISMCMRYPKHLIEE